MDGSVIAAVFGGILKIAIGAIIVIIGFVIWGSYSLFSKDEYKTKKPIKPDVIIETKTVNGVQTSDTTYIYKF